MKRSILATLAASGFIPLALLSGCGSGEGAPPPPAISVSVSPASASLPAGTAQGQQFTATVTNDPSNRGVNWAIIGCIGGPSVCGSVSPASTASGVPTIYMPPPTVPNPASLNITATSVADSTKSGFASMTITSPIEVSVSPSSALIAAHTTRQFTATVHNDPGNRGVIWSLQGAGCNGAPCGRLDSSTANPVTYIAPDDTSIERMETLKATAVADNTASASVAITITFAIMLSVTPASLTIPLGDTRQFTAALTDPENRGVAWSVTGCPTGVSCGFFSPTTTLNNAPTSYTAPASVPNDIQATVRATSVADPTRSATAALTISTTAQPISVTVSPLTASVPIGGLIDFVATLNNGSAGFGVSWNIAGCTSEPCGSIVNIIFIANGQQVTATYAAPSTPQTAQPGNQVTVKVTSIEDNTKSASATVTLTPAPMNFSTQNFPAGNSPVAVAIADFNGDGKLDLAVADNGDSTTADDGGVSIMLGNGDGTFQAARQFRAGRNPVAIAIGDFNGDGRLDLVVSAMGDGPTGGNRELSILLGNGDGTFQAPITRTAGRNTFTLAVGDFNGDGKLDVAASDVSDPSVNADGGVELFLGNGDGTLQPPTLIAAGKNPVALVVKDWNGDGKLDLAVANQHDPDPTHFNGGVSILLGNGDGTFQPPTFIRVAQFPTSLTTGDLNGDGKADLFVASFVSLLGLSGSVHNVLLGNGDGSFRPAASAVTARTRGSPGAIFPLSPAVADFDSDMKADVAEIFGHSVTVLRGNGDGTFQGQLISTLGELTFQGRLIFSAGPNPIALAIGDFNGDGRPDVVVANLGSNFVSVLLNTSGP